MVYEGDVKVFSDDGKAFTFNSAEGVAWLQMYVDMNKAGTLDTTVLTGRRPHRAQRLLGRRRAVLRHGPEPGPPGQGHQRHPLRATSRMVPSPLGKSGVAGKGLMSISVKKDTKFPNASIALAQFFTNPRSMVQFAKQVAIYPSSPAAYDDPFFSSAPAAIEDSARGPSPRRPSRRTRTSSRPSPNKADVNDIVRKAVESALFNEVARPSGPRQGRRRREQAPGVGLTGSDDPVLRVRTDRWPVPSGAGQLRIATLASQRTITGHDMTRKRSITPYTFLLPALVLLGIFVVYPIIAVVYYSFTDYDIAEPPVWVGLDNFAEARRGRDVPAGA